MENLIRIEEYFLKEVTALVRRGLSAEQTLKDLEPRLPDWIRGIPLVWGTPRYAILRVYRGLTKKENDPEPGWQRFKPSAVPEAEAGRLAQSLRCAGTLEDFFRMAREAREGGDGGLRLSVLEAACRAFAGNPEAQVELAEALVEESRREESVLEKGDFFNRARALWDCVLSEHPDHPGALLGKGRYLVMMAFRGGDDPEPGMKLLRKVLGLKLSGRPAAEAEFFLGIGHRRLGDEAAALGRFRRALGHDPAFGPALAAMG